ncbi:MAG: TetR/AcrR family transcriptional regulator [Rubrobacter sp.]|nr:TetR/AcrR family transcriptional regulator [Rubrobacter sp.]
MSFNPYLYGTLARGIIIWIMSPTTESTYHERLLNAMADAIVELGYETLTVADIVRLARVSKRTFYEHFSGKEECLLALYEANSARIIRAVETAIADTPRGGDRIEAGVLAYLLELQARPAVSRTVIVAILHAGPRGLAVRREVNRRFAALLLREMGEAGTGGPNASALAMALVGGVNELLLEAVENDRTDRITELVGPVTALLRPFFVSAS